MQYLDLSHTLDADFPVHPDDEAPVFEVLTDGEHPYRLWTIKSHMHAGTHIDAPSHFFKGDKELSDINIDRFVGRGVLVELGDRMEVDADFLSKFDIREGDVVLMHAGWDKYLYGDSDKYYLEHPIMDEGAGEYLVSKKVKMVCTDYPSVDHYPHPVHPILLKAEILLVENVTNLEKLVGIERFEVMAFPPKIKMDGSFVRVVARVD